MNGRGPEPLEHGQMLADRIALVLGKAIARILFIQLVHERIPSSFGQDGGRRNSQTSAVSLHDGLLRYREILEAPRDSIQNGLRARAQVGPQSGFGRTVSGPASMTKRR